MTQFDAQPTFINRVPYKDLRAATDWLEKAFGFVPVMVATDPNGNVVHAEMRFGNGRIDVASEWENSKAPCSVGGINTQNISVQLDGGIEKHCEQARAAGGSIIQEPKYQFHGDHTYRVKDPEGHVWSFWQKVREVSVADLEAGVPGMKVWRRAQ